MPKRSTPTARSPGTSQTSRPARRADSLRNGSGHIKVFNAIYPPLGGTASTYAWSIDKGEIAGTYTSDGSTYHGFVRDADGGIERFDPQGAMST
ncbi:MAG: hypothetical protein ACREHV_14500 [Rhizomicrobium sp.]